MGTTELIIPTSRAERTPNYQPLAVANNDGATLMQIVERAMREPNFDIEKIQQILTLKERWDANEARKAFTDDMAAFKQNPPIIYKNKHVHFKSERTGNVTEYDHATHAEVTMKIIAGLAEHGFSHRWVPTQPNGQVCVTCIITHRLGHSESQEMTAPPDTSGNKSPIQAIASTKTLLERYTLLAATGLSADDLPDADDREEDTRPEVPQDVWTGLGDAAKEGEDALKRMWQALSEATRALIKEHYDAEWSDYKAKAKAVDAGRRSIDTATGMRRIMNLDIEEMALAKQVEDENERLNREGLLDPAWDVLTAEERRAWKGWLDWRKQHPPTSKNGR